MPRKVSMMPCLCFALFTRNVSYCANVAADAIHPEDSQWLFNMASGVWFNAETEQYCQEVEDHGFVYGKCMVTNGQMYFVPDASEENEGQQESSCQQEPAKDSPSKEQPVNEEEEADTNIEEAGTPDSSGMANTLLDAF